jgi:hypothetical protein
MIVSPMLVRPSLFLRLVFGIPALDDEDWTNGYPIAYKYRDIFDDILPKWRVTPLPAFDANGQFIKAHDLEIALRGSLVLVYFELRHYSIKDKRSNAVASNTVSAIATQVKILERGADHLPARYKSRLLKGPTILPQSPSKRKDQVNAVNAFHPGSVAILFTSGVLLTVPITAPSLPAGGTSSHQDTPTPSSTSKSEGKKRAIDDDGEATATDESDKGAKRKKAHTK